MNFDEIIKHFTESGALLEGHFQLSSGLHSSKYLQCALALKNPHNAEVFGAAIAQKLAHDLPSVVFNAVFSPAIGGLIIGFAVAQKLRLPFFWTERENNLMTLRRGFSVSKNEKLLVVEDVITTGGSTREAITTVSALGATVSAAASIIDRSGGAAEVGVPRIALATLEIPTYSEENCPLCADGGTVIKPGSRKI